MDIISLADASTIIKKIFSRQSRPRKKLLLSDWSDKYRILSSKASPEAGRWRTSRMPHLREPMNALSLTSIYRKIVCMFPIQMGKTEIGLNWSGYIIDHAPAPTLSVQPTLELRDRYILQRVNPMLDSTPKIAETFNNKRRRDGANNRDVKDFAGGILVFSGANSPSSLRQMPIKNVIMDEVDEFPDDVGGQGDAIGLIEGRQSNFRSSKTLIISSPTIKGASKIEKAYLDGDQRKWNIPCPHCGKFQILKWKSLQWQRLNSVIKDVWYNCEFCSEEIREHHKKTFLENGVWIATNKNAPYPSYHLTALNSPIGLGLTWLELANEWLSVQGNKIAMKRFINTRLAETWEDTENAVKWRLIRERGEAYKLKSIPEGVLALTAGLDTQNDRIAIQLVGWGRGAQLWVLDYIELPDDPNEQVKKYLNKTGALYDYLSHSFSAPSGRTLKIQAAAWDTGGHRSDAVYMAVRSRVVPVRLMAIKGHSIKGKPILAPRASAQDVNYRGKVIKKGVSLWMVGTDTAKDFIMSHLLGDYGKIADDRMIRFSDELDDDYYKMLTAERYDPEKNRWQKRPGSRNEALDTLVYSIAASRHPELRLHAMTGKQWDKLSESMGHSTKKESDQAKKEPSISTKKRRHIRRNHG